MKKFIHSIYDIYEVLNDTLEECFTGFVIYTTLISIWALAFLYHGNHLLVLLFMFYLLIWDINKTIHLVKSIIASKKRKTRERLYNKLLTLEHHSSLSYIQKLCEEYHEAESNSPFKFQ